MPVGFAGTMGRAPKGLEDGISRVGRSAAAPKIVARPPPTTRHPSVKNGKADR